MGRYDLGSSHIAVLYDKFNFILFIVFLFVALAILGMFTLTWGLTAMIGLLLLAMGFIIIFLNRASQWIFLTCVILGVIFIFFSYAGFEVTTVDLRVIPGLESLHNWVHGL